jgi:DNA-binding LytR/AlgR family response regulator
VELRKNNGAAQTPPPSLFIKSGYEHVRVEMENILYVESYGNYVQFVTNGQKILSRLTMSEAEVLLPASAFLRIHRSYIVAKSKVAKFEKRSIWIGQIELPIGPGYCGKIEKLIK